MSSAPLIMMLSLILGKTLVQIWVFQINVSVPVFFFLFFFAQEEDCSGTPVKVQKTESAAELEMS